MSSTENRADSSFEGLRIPGLVQSQELVEQLSFTPDPMTPASLPPYVTRQLEPESSPGLADLDTARQPVSQAGMADSSTSQPGNVPGSTRALLLEVQPQVTQALANIRAVSNTTSLRQPVVIRGRGKRTHPIRPPQGRRHVISIAALLMLLVVTVGTLLVATPLGQEAGLHFAPFSTGSSLINNGNGNNLSLKAQATATAIVHQQNDGIDPNASSGGPTLSNTSGSLSWPYGVCTYWANLRYHELTGVWVSWHGNAYQWAAGASMAGWHVSSTPHVPSIIVLQPGVQGASGAGHVAVVESIVDSTTVRTSNMNWYANGGGYGIVSYYNFNTGPGVSFIWK
jgi:surface antigen